jgi:hypothetical protein
MIAIDVILNQLLISALMIQRQSLMEWNEFDNVITLWSGMQ